MIRLTQPELVHDKKQQDSPSPDDTIKKESEGKPVTSRAGDQASSGAYSHGLFKKMFGFIANNKVMHLNTLTLILDSVDESGSRSKDAPSPSRTSKVMGKPAVPSGGSQQVTTSSSIVQRLPAFLDNHNYAKSPMQVRGEFCPIKSLFICFGCNV